MSKGVSGAIEMVAVKFCEQIVRGDMTRALRNRDEQFTFSIVVASGFHQSLAKERVQAGLKSSLIMQEESTSARAGALASDWYYLGRIRTVEEIQQAINDLSADAIVEHLRRCPPRDFTIVTLGPKPLRLRAEFKNANGAAVGK